MITKAQLIRSITTECTISIHLHSKIDAAAAQYRPTPGQRSLEELLRYLSYCGIAGSRALATGDWKIFGEYEAAAARQTFAAFPSAMTRQMGEIESFIGALAEETLIGQQATLPGRGAVPLAEAFLNGPLKWLNGYKMQLFLYAKASGVGAIGTSNLWAGIDWRH